MNIGQIVKNAALGDTQASTNRIIASEVAILDEGK
jgi:hypothetical protein